MDTPWTLGPWQVVDDADLGTWVEDSNGREVVAPNYDRDARLIALAPEMAECIAGMIESYDLLTGPESPFQANDLALGSIRGFFVGELPRAKSLLARARGEVSVP